jgi:hypothetical protein
MLLRTDKYCLLAGKAFLVNIVPAILIVYDSESELDTGAFLSSTVHPSTFKSASTEGSTSVPPILWRIFSNDM